jgi:hypothetical protein
LSASEPTFAKLLEIDFGGYFLCRIATDPDPTNEQRGVSGYTMALVTEDPLDQVIRTQVTPDFAARNLREPAQRMGIRIGVDVTDVRFDGEPYPRGQEALLGGRLYLEGENPPFPGPIFDSRNNIVGSDDNMSFVVNPFELRIQSDAVEIRAKDFLNPAQPDQKIWQIEDPETYIRRLPAPLISQSMAAMEAVRVFDPFSYFASRRRYLTERIRELETQKPLGPEDEARLEGLKSRMFQLDFWGDRVINKLAFQLPYAFNVNGPQSVKGQERLGGTVDCTQPWPVSFWFGSWDGDLLVGVMQGTLSMPFLPD